VILTLLDLVTLEDSHILFFASTASTHTGMHTFVRHILLCSDISADHRPTAESKKNRTLDSFP